MSRRNQPEEALQIAVSSFIKRVYPDVRFNADSSGIWVSPGRAAKMKMMRSSHKHLDLWILEARGIYHGLIIELKASGKSPFKLNGDLREVNHIQDQQEAIHTLRAKGYWATFATGIDEAMHFINIYMNFPANY